MKVWLYRLLAVALAGAGLALVVAKVHAAPTALETALGGALLSIATVVLLWRRPKAAAILNACWILAAFAAGIILTQNGVSFALSSGAPESPDAMAAKLRQDQQSADPADYVLSAREKKLTTIDGAFAYVRDNIRFEAYDGILRGADGTFNARAGNAFDRAMLLAAILQANKFPVRLVTGQLPQPQAERLFQRIFEPATAPTASPRSGALIQRIFDRARRDDNAILAAVGNQLPAISGPSHDDVVKEIEQHAWVQAQQNGRWIDLDPSFPDSTAGRAYAAVQQSFDTPPVPWMQQVTIRVIAETVENGTLAENVSLEQTMPAYRLIDKPVYLYHQVYRPFNGQGGELQFIFGNKDTQEPVLIMGDSPSVGKPIDFGSGASSAGTPPPNAVQAAANAFGTPAPGPVNANAKAFVAEWLEFEIAYPGGRKEVVRRTLTDRAGTAWRNAAVHDASKLHDLARNKEGLIALQTVYDMAFSAGKHDLLAFTDAALELSQGVPAQNPQSPTMFEQMWPFAIRNMSWFIASDHVIVPAINDTPGIRFYADSPRIFIWSAGPDPAGKSDDIVVVSDLRRDTLRAVAKDATFATAVAQHKVWFGALEGALEHELSAPPQSVSGATHVSTSSLAESGDLMTVTPGSSVSAGDPEIQARLQSALAAGDTLVVPKQALSGGTAGWWQIGHDTGDVRAVLNQLNADIGNIPPPKGPGVNYINYVKNPEYLKDPTVEYERLCMELGLPEDKASSGRVCAASTPAYGKIAAVTFVAVAVVLIVVWAAWPS